MIKHLAIQPDKTGEMCTLSSSPTKVPTFGYDRTNDLWPLTLINGGGNYTGI
jgi:hypothetical protein